MNIHHKDSLHPQLRNTFPKTYITYAHTSDIILGVKGKCKRIGDMLTTKAYRFQLFWYVFVFMQKKFIEIHITFYSLHLSRGLENCWKIWIWLLCEPTFPTFINFFLNKVNFNVLGVFVTSATEWVKWLTDDIQT